MSIPPTNNMNREGKVEITKEQAEDIFSDNGESLAIAKKTVFCHRCFPENHRNVEVDIEHYFVNELNDVILRGKCTTCGHSVARYIESGEIPAMTKRARRYWVRK